MAPRSHSRGRLARVSRLRCRVRLGRLMPARERRLRKTFTVRGVPLPGPLERCKWLAKSRGSRRPPHARPVWVAQRRGSAPRPGTTTLLMRRSLGDLVPKLARSRPMLGRFSRAARLAVLVSMVPGMTALVTRASGAVRGSVSCQRSHPGRLPIVAPPV